MKSSINDYGSLIVFEGISASGKSELIKRVSHHLKNINHKVVISKWNNIKIIKDSIDFLARVKLLNAYVYSFLQLISFIIEYNIKIKKYLRKGYIVLSDRYIYTGIVRNKVNGIKHTSLHTIQKNIIRPAVICFKDTNPDICAQRISKRAKPLYRLNKQINRDNNLKDKNLYYLNILRDEYIKLFNSLKKHKIVYIDDSTGIEHQIRYISSCILKKSNRNNYTNRR